MELWRTELFFRTLGRWADELVALAGVFPTPHEIAGRIRLCAFLHNPVLRLRLARPGPFEPLGDVVKEMFPREKLAGEMLGSVEKNMQLVSGMGGRSRKDADGKVAHYCDTAGVEVLSGARRKHAKIDVDHVYLPALGKQPRIFTNG
jgi:hypothetical protein